jgi:hypothetical protein
MTWRAEENADSDGWWDERREQQAAARETTLLRDDDDEPVRTGNQLQPGGSQGRQIADIHHALKAERFATPADKRSLNAAVRRHVTRLWGIASPALRVRLMSCPFESHSYIRNIHLIFTAIRCKRCVVCYPFRQVFTRLPALGRRARAVTDKRRSHQKFSLSTSQAVTRMAPRAFTLSFAREVSRVASTRLPN